MVRILWMDARNMNCDMVESEIEDLKPEKLLAPYDCIGFVVRETEEVILIAQGFLPKWDHRDEDLYRHLLSIPKVQIVKIVELEGRHDPQPKPRVVSRVEVVCL
jgi:hypothetical protein